MTNEMKQVISKLAHKQDPQKAQGHGENDTSQYDGSTAIAQGSIKKKRRGTAQEAEDEANDEFADNDDDVAASDEAPSRGGKPIAVDGRDKKQNTKESCGACLIF